MLVGTAITANYLDKARACLLSLPNCGVPSFVVTNGFKATSGLRNAFPGLTWQYSPPNVLSSVGNIQYGGWIEYLPDSVLPDEMIIFVDSDSVFQRELSYDERELLSSLDDNTVGMVYNVSPKDTLGDEIERAYFFDPPPMDIVDMLYPNMADTPCHNCGLISARLTWWRRLREAFLEEWDGFSSLVGNNSILHVPGKKDKHERYSKCQTLICWLIYHVLKSKVVSLPYHIQAHGHFPLPHDCSITARPPAVYHKDRLVWFAHHFPLLLGWGC